MQVGKYKRTVQQQFFALYNSDFPFKCRGICLDKCSVHFPEQHFLCSNKIIHIPDPLVKSLGLFAVAASQL